jgi:hypothetical protein
MRAVLTIVAEYDSATTTKEYVKHQLELAAEHLANNGLLTGEGEAVVDEWSYKVEVM